MTGIAHNARWNAVGQGIPLLVGLAAIPITAQALGAARFGLLGLIWAVLGYAGALDLGLGRATTKFVAEHLSRGDQTTVRRVATVAVTGQIVLGSLAGLLLFAATPLLVDRVFHVPGAVAAESRVAFRLVALSVPLVVGSLGLRAILEAAQRFDLVNLIRMPTSILVFVVPAVVASLGGSLALIVALLAAVRLAGALAFAFALGRAIPAFRWDWGGARETLRALLGYAGWVAVSNTINPMLVYLERFMLGSLAGVAAVAYYAAPYEAVTRLLIVPASLASALFPALSASGAGEAARLRHERLFQRALRFLLLTLGAPIFVVIGCAGPLMTAWLGPVYAVHSAPALAILAAGVLINALAHLPAAYLLGRGRPDLPAKFQIVELVLYVVAAWLLVRAFGVTGAAIAWTGRVTLDAALLGAALWRAEGFEPTRWYGPGSGRALGAVAVLAVVTVGAALGLPPQQRVAVVVAAALAFLVYGWRRLLAEEERVALRAVLT
jgi:O-antigen/teichoic acid export membrane protein